MNTSPRPQKLYTSQPEGKEREALSPTTWLMYMWSQAVHQMWWTRIYLTNSGIMFIIRKQRIYTSRFENRIWQTDSIWSSCSVSQALLMPTMGTVKWAANLGLSVFIYTTGCCACVQLSMQLQVCSSWDAYMKNEISEWSWICFWLFCLLMPGTERIWHPMWVF